MVLSINIPVYNIEVTNLVLTLHDQARSSGIEYEIRIYDDGSAEAIKEKNRLVAGEKNIFYYESEKNIGRAAIRNKMGLDSTGSYLLFIDADSKIISDDYLKIYLHHAGPGKVLCGGTAYSDEKPASDKILRWVYGHHREAIPASVRNSKKGFIITSNNFLIDRQIFERIHFREIPGPYGHEDTLLGFDLYAAGIIPQHTDNPVEHTGLEDSLTFLNKTKAALENLKYISENILSGSPEFQQQINFLRQYNKITRFIPPALIRLIFKTCRKRIEKNLTGRNPRLSCFDLYKLGYYSS
ncbi:MAG: glycosyltransferase [Mariniphaga sp.]|nr:glycosyltransferase [Mariniphaga sp.]MDD4426405.1 glycosyltransferase [Mariniphaga sp.]